eukprot:TRINITY_DN328_c0_g1_i2.p1 TRINITY_DN328_c0_g1~~TRINITY_DN328_c0_g1_i2.p1  ORF type:complete len:495 (-),score=127.56 TRINITY_DN328_c0_g1_i2:290-1774(-)
MKRVGSLTHLQDVPALKERFDDYLISLEQESTEPGTWSTDRKLYSKLFAEYLMTRKQKIDFDSLEPLRVGSDFIREYEELCNERVPRDEIRDLLGKLVIVKLNGGLGTTMGMRGPKSLVEVVDGKNFLDLLVRQIKVLKDDYQVDVPLVLMNSFNTDADTKSVMESYSDFPIYQFSQHAFPKILKDLLVPAVSTVDGTKSASEWYPPGHGDFFSSLYENELFEQLYAEGRRYIFISNVDNLGAEVDFHLLRFFEKQKLDFMMEVTPKTRADVKGGTLVRKNGRPYLLELAAVPDERKEEFKSITRFKVFNTNNLWLSFDAMREKMKHGGVHMPVIANEKFSDGKRVLQLEQAMGSAISSFERSVSVSVPRSRFLPVKNTGDLLLIQSNLFDVRKGFVQIKQARVEKMGGPYLPLIRLGHRFMDVDAYLTRFKQIPDIIDLDALTVSGDVTFGRGVRLAGTVIIVAPEGSRIDVPDGTFLENKVVSGNLRILDHF